MKNLIFLLLSMFMLSTQSYAASSLQSEETISAVDDVGLDVADQIFTLTLTLNDTFYNSERVTNVTHCYKNSTNEVPLFSTVVDLVSTDLGGRYYKNIFNNYNNTEAIYLYNVMNLIHENVLLSNFSTPLVMYQS